MNECVLVRNNQELQKSDYELWSPSDVLSDDNTKQCLLGRHMQYTRRKRTADCYNKMDYEPVVMGSTCPCTLDDYQCDYCYINDGTGKCVWACEGTPNKIPSPCRGEYTVSQGYRLVPGDVCDLNSGINLTPLILPCPGNSATSSMVNPSSSTPKSYSAMIAVTIITILIIVAIVVAIAVSYKTKKPQALWAKCSGEEKAVKYSQVSLNEEEQEELVHSDTTL